MNSVLDKKSAELEATAKLKLRADHIIDQKRFILYFGMDYLQKYWLNSWEEYLSELNSSAKFNLSFPYKIIFSNGPIILNKTPARAIKNYSIPEAISWLDRLRESSKSCVDGVEINDIIRRLSSLPDSETVRVVRKTGFAYRISFFDYKLQRRSQCNIGNLLLIVGNNHADHIDLYERQNAPRMDAGILRPEPYISMPLDLVYNGRPSHLMICV